MTTQKPNQPEGRQENFLDQVRSNIDTIIGEFEGVRDWDTDDLTRTSIPVRRNCGQAVLQERDRGGQEEAERAEEKEQNPRFQKAEKTAAKPTGQVKKSWPKNKYQN